MPVLGSLAALVFAFVVGAALCSLARREFSLAALLTTPAIGFGVFLLVVFACSYAGVATGAAALPAALALLVAAAVVLAIRRPAIDRRDALIAACGVLGVYVIVGWPLAGFGTDWVGFLNGDMTFYIASATNFQAFSLFQVPSLETALRHADLYRWTAPIYAYGAQRPGWEVLLAAGAAVGKLSAARAYMALALAVHAAVVLAVASLVAQRRIMAAFAVGVLCISPMLSYSTYMGLVPQQLGTALWCVFLAWSSLADVPLRARLFVLPVSAAAGALVYPELAPFVALAIIILAIGRRTFPWPAVTGGALGLVLLGPYAPVTLFFALASLFSGGSAKTIGHVFTPILEPVGAANIWGLLPVSEAPDALVTQFAIAAGLLATLAYAVYAARSLRKPEPCIAIVVPLAVVSFMLIVRGSDFGAFKAALYSVPFVGASLAASASRRAWTRAAVAAYVVAALPVQIHYASSALGDLSSSRFVSAPGATARHVLSDIERSAHAKATALVVDSPLSQIAELAALNAGDAPVWSLDAPSGDLLQFALPVSLHPVITDDGRRLSAAQYVRDVSRSPRLRTAGVYLPVGDATASLSVAPQDAAARTDDAAVLFYSRLTVLNGEDHGGALVRSAPLRDVRNHLAFTESSIGTSGANNGAPIRFRSFYELQQDPFLRGALAQPVGRYLVFSVLKPTARVRMRVEFSSTALGDGADKLPPARVSGDGTLALPIVGRGAARVYSPPLAVALRERRAFVGIDMGVNPKRLPDRRRGMWLLFGRSVPYDPREFVTYARDISLVDAADPLPPAPAEASFPAAIHDPALQFSGIYEDGWIAERSFAVLNHRAGDDVLHVRFMLPGRDRSASRCTVLLDGREATSFGVVPGEADEVIDASRLTAGPHRVELRFDRAFALGPDDSRPASAKLEDLAFRQM